MCSVMRPSIETVRACSTPCGTSSSPSLDRPDGADRAEPLPLAHRGRIPTGQPREPLGDGAVEFALEAVGAQHQRPPDRAEAGRGGQDALVRAGTATVGCVVTGGSVGCGKRSSWGTRQAPDGWPAPSHVTHRAPSAPSPELVSSAGLPLMATSRPAEPTTSGNPANSPPPGLPLVATSRPAEPTTSGNPAPGDVRRARPPVGAGPSVGLQRQLYVPGVKSSLEKLSKSTKLRSASLNTDSSGEDAVRVPLRLRLLRGLDRDVAVPRQAGSGRDELADDHVLLEAEQRVGLALHRRLR